MNDRLVLSSSLETESSVVLELRLSTSRVILNLDFFFEVLPVIIVVNSTQVLVIASEFYCVQLVSGAFSLLEIELVASCAVWPCVIWRLLEHACPTVASINRDS